jgi:UDP-glucose 4-epimerase
MNILITGVAGLLGSRLADWILNNTECDIIGIDDLSGGYKENVPDKVKFYQENLSTANLDSIFEKHNVDVIYHFAAYAAEGLSPFIRKYNYQNNLLASTNLINHAITHNIQRFVFASSMSVYGNIYEPPFYESLPPRPIDPYGIAKFAVEQDLKVAYEQHKLPYTIIRPHNFYGRNQNIWDKYRNVLGIWMWQIINGYSPTIFGDGSQVRAFSYVDDSLEPFWNASQKDECVDEIINLGGIHEVSIQEACDILLKVTETDLQPDYHEMRHEAHYAYSTWDKSVSMLEFEHKTNLEDGLKQMWSWAQHQPNRKRFVWKNYELDKGIYSYWKNEEDSNSTNL